MVIFHTMTVKSRIEEILQHAYRPLHMRDIVEMHILAYGEDLNKNTASVFLKELVNEGSVERIDYDTKFSHFISNFRGDESIEIDFANKIDVEGHGMLYTALVDVDMLVKIASITSNFSAYPRETINAIHSEIDKLELMVNPFRIAFSRNPILQAFKDSESIEVDDEKISLCIERPTPFFPLAGWDKIEALRKSNIVHWIQKGMKIDMPVVVTIFLSESDEESVNYVKNQFLFINDESQDKSIKKFNDTVISAIDNLRASIRIDKDETLKHIKNSIDERESALKLKMRELNDEMAKLKLEREAMEKKVLDRE